ncbi:MAG TPA: hypothetical protein PKC76_15250 [Saprospiraceae bacterium]|nr:hypothetical protein [Saprospiraceae bacterium]HMP25491.1 hypothetical protein [Saprospiraceae bacterium]
MARKKTSTEPARKAGEPIREMPTPLPLPTQPGSVNTLALSPDMNVLYLIESGRVIPYSLFALGGVMIGTLQGQIVVTTALTAPPDSKINTVILSTIAQSWMVSFLPKQSRISVIGVTDIDLGIKEEESPFRSLVAKGVSVNIKSDTLNIRRSESSLIFTVIPAKRDTGETI